MTSNDGTDDLLSLLLAEDGFALPDDGPPPIPRWPDGDDAPASPAQERLWVLEQVGGPSAAYNLALAVRFGATIDGPALQRALDALVARHEPLRTDLVERDGRLVQRVHPAAPVPLPVEHATPEALPAALERAAAAPFALGGGGLLFRARWFAVEGEPGVLLLGFHHAVVDGWSAAIVLRELARLYDSALRGGDASEAAAGLPPLPIRYRDYAAWLADPARRAERSDARAYWAARLDTLPATLDLPRDHGAAARGAVGAAASGAVDGVVPVRLDAALTARLEALGRACGATPYMVLLAGYAALLARFTGARDLPIGAPVANRDRVETEGLVGFLVDTMVLRTEVPGDIGFGALVERVRDACVEDFRHRDLPFGELVAMLRPERRAGATPLIHTMFNLLPVSGWEERVGELCVTGASVEVAAARFDLSMDLEAHDGLVTGRLEYRAGAVAPAVAAAMADAYRTLLSAAVADPARPIDTLPLIGRPDADAFLAAVHGTTATDTALDTGAPSGTLHGLFVERARAMPDAVALIDGARTVTYAELERRSAAVAARLRGLGVGAETAVGVCLERSADLAAALLGVLRAGGVLLPLDPAYPPERLAFMLADSGAPVLIARVAPDWLGADGGVRVLTPDAFGAGAAPGHAAPEDTVTPDGLATLVYTSGSTGRPKGVMGLHRGAVNRIRWMEGAFPWMPGEVSCQKTTITFTDFIWEFFGPLLAGVPSLVIPAAAVTDPARLAALLSGHGVTRLVLVPSLLRALLDGVADPARDLASLRLCVTSGEAIPPDLAARFAAALPDCRLLNLYGSSEVSADATWHLVEPGAAGPVPIGRPIPGNRVLLLDAGGNPVPPGAPGEIHVGGVGLARGYWRRPDLTAERFVQDSTGMPPTGAPGARLFRTGDLGRWRGDGTLDYLGRLDRQVKIRGVRVEPGEVQAVLAGHPAVRDTVVVARPLPSGELGLVAYVVGRDGVDGDVDVDTADLRRFLRARLPAALVPAVFVPLERLPLNPNGKIDVAALPDPAAAIAEPRAGAAAGPLAAPLTDGEALVAAAWAEVLGVAGIGAESDFFDLGGDSLLAIRAMTRVNAAFATALPVAALFEAPTPRALAARLTAGGGHAPALPPMVPGPRPARLPMSFNQAQLWLAERTQGASAYNVPIACRLDGALDADALERALAAQSDRHEALRTRLTARDGTLAQEIDPPGAFRLDRRDLTGADEAAVRRLIDGEAARPFALADEAPFRAILATLGPESWLLVMVVHHSASDGSSGTILMRELEADYRRFVTGAGDAPGTPAVQPADLALWQHRCLDGGAFAAPLEAWRAELAGAQTLLALPLMTPPAPLAATPPDTPAGLAGRVAVPLTRAVVERLAAAGRAAQGTPHMTMLAAFALLLARYTGQDDLLVGTPAAARDRRALEDTVGYLVNTLALRIDLGGRPSFGDLVGRVRDRLLAAFERQQVPFPLVVDAVRPARAPDRPPLVQALFVMQDARPWTPALPGVTATPVAAESALARFDLTLVVSETGDGVTGTLEYAADRIDAATARRMADGFAAILDAVTAAPDRPLAELDLLGAGDRRLMAVLNGAEEAYAGPARLHHLVTRRAALTPEAPAVWWEGRTLSYGDLDRLSDRAARRLRAEGIRPGDRVGLVAERGPGLIVALVGILKAGAAYVPVDPAYPAERIAGMLADAAVAAIVADSAVAGRAATLLLLDPETGLDDSGLGDAECGDGPEPPSVAGDAEADATACVIFTSGSTGRPKGVMVGHRALCRLAAALAGRYGVAPGDRLLQLVALGFDVAASDIALAFTAGATLCLAARDALLPGRTLADTLARSGATHAQLPAAVLAATPVAPLPALRVLAVGGESCPAEVAERWARGRRLFVAYGPTETTVTATLAEHAPGMAPSCIGRAVAGARLHVLDHAGRPVPAGVPGELHIGGPGVSAGYIGRPELTAERFRPDPFDPTPGARLYRSGDRVRLDGNGMVHFLGRIDRQIKLRGFRIEPGEIEAVLAGLPGIARALVGVRTGGDGDRHLAAWLLPEAGAAPDLAVVRNAAKAALPPHMVPATLTPIAAVPLTAHGKVDWEALLAPVPDRAEPAATGPEATGSDATGPAARPAAVAEATAATLERVAAIWRAALEREDVGPDENFFDAGGHSLRLVQVHAALERAFGQALPIADLFRHPTIRAIATRLSGSGDGALPEAAPDSVTLAGAEPIAIIGMAGRFPGAPDLDAFWRLLVEGREGIRRLDADDLLADGLDPTVLERPDHVPARGVVPEAELFDAGFFGFSPRDAETLDPQHRVLLECAWQAMEDAGYDPGRAGGPVGVFAGAGLNTYLRGALHPDGVPAGSAGYHALTGNDKDFLPSQIAYRLDLRGPAVAVQTACSTSLVAVDMACQALRAGRCRMALAGGVAIRFPQAEGYRHEPGMILSPDGHCRPFAADAAGTVPGGGAGLVLLKPLSLARADGDRVLAVIRGGAVTNDGAAKVGYTAPGVDGQTAAVAGALAAAGLTAGDIDYVEAHGTGTELGDPVEVAALARVFAGRSRPLLLGAVKSNIGHADAAAGIAGLIKTVLALRHGVLPPSLHAATPNPRIDFAAGPFAVVTEARPWPKDEAEGGTDGKAGGGRPRRAGVSAFGIGGTNAHLVLEEAPPAPPSPPDDRPQLLQLSARTPAALERMMAALAGHLAAHPDLPLAPLPLADVAHTLRAGRAAFPHRAALVARDTAEAAARLASPAPGPHGLVRGEAAATPPAVAFLFPGQGSQFPRMGAALYREDAAYRATVDRCAEALRPHLGADLAALLYGDTPADAAALRRTSLTQPALFTVSYALAARWLELGVEPAAMLGHSVGEYVAATLAGVFELEDALALVAERGRLVESLPPGAMLAVPLGENEVAERMDAAGLPPLSIAAVNGPRQTVVAGPLEAIDELRIALAGRGVAALRLETSHAFHSAMLDPLVPVFAERVGRRQPRAPQRRFLSNVTGSWITNAQATDPAYWARHLRGCVRFADGVAALREAGVGILLEVGPGHALCGLARASGWSGPALPVLGTAGDAVAGDVAGDNATGDRRTLETLGRLWTAGVPVRVPAAAGRRRVALPTYPFERTRHWPAARPPAMAGAPVASPPVVSATPARASALPAKRADSESWFYRPAWVQAPPVPAVALSGSWLLFLDDGGLGARLADALRAAGAGVVTVAAGSRFADLGGDRFTLAPGDTEGYRGLLDALGVVPARIVHLWGLDAGCGDGAALERGFHSLIALARALGGRASGSRGLNLCDVTHPVRIDAVATGTAHVTGEEALRPAAAVALGAVKVIPLEDATLTCRAIDLDPAAPRALDHLLDELGAADDAPLTARRGRHRWQPEVRPAALPAAGLGATRLRRHGTYLITGGFGGMGAAIARDLGTTLAARLVLVGRTPLPERERWPALLTESGAPDDGAVAARIRLIQEIEAAGGAVLAVAADIADAAAMADVLARARARFGTIHGVVHTAGLADLAGVIQARSRADTDAILAPKVAGTRVLDRLLADGPPLDFMLLCSTLGSILHGAKFGQVGYAGANEFLDLFAAERTARTGQFTVAVNWDDWTEAGMTVAAHRRWGLAPPTADEALTPAEGVAAFRRVLEADYPRLAVSVRDLPALAARGRALMDDLAHHTRPDHAGTERTGAAATPTATVTAGTPTERLLGEQWCALLGVPAVDGAANFFELGGHSLLAMQMLAFIRQSLGVEIGLAALFEAPTLAGLSARIDALRAPAPPAAAPDGEEEFVL